MPRLIFLIPLLFAGCVAVYHEAPKAVAPPAQPALKLSTHCPYCHDNSEQVVVRLEPTGTNYMLAGIVVNATAHFHCKCCKQEFFGAAQLIESQGGWVCGQGTAGTYGMDAMKWQTNHLPGPKMRHILSTIQAPMPPMPVERTK